MCKIVLFLFNSPAVSKTQGSGCLGWTDQGKFLLLFIQFAFLNLEFKSIFFIFKAMLTSSFCKAKENEKSKPAITKPIPEL